MSGGQEGGVRSVWWAVRVPGAPAPFDTAHLRVYYPARPTGSDAERLSGVLAADPAGAPYPVVLLVSGVNVGQDAYRWLAVELAARGVVAVTYDWVGVLFAGLHGITPGVDLDAARPDGYGSRPTSPSLRPVLDALAQLTGPLDGLLDLDRVALVGSLGRRYGRAAVGAVPARGPCGRQLRGAHHGGDHARLAGRHRAAGPGGLPGHAARRHPRRRDQRLGRPVRRGRGHPRRPDHPHLRRGAARRGRHQPAGAAGRRQPLRHRAPARSHLGARLPRRGRRPPSRKPPARSWSTCCPGSSPSTFAANRPTASTDCWHSSAPPLRSPRSVGGKPPCSRTSGTRSSSPTGSPPSRPGSPCSASTWPSTAPRAGAWWLCPTCACTGARRSPAARGQGREHRLPVSRLGVRAGWRVHEDPGEPARPGHPEQGPGRLVPGAGALRLRLGLHGRPARGRATADPGLAGVRRPGGERRQVPRGDRRVPVEGQLRADPGERLRHRARAVRARRRIRQPGEARGSRVRARDPRRVVGVRHGQPAPAALQGPLVAGQPQQRGPGQPPAGGHLGRLDAAQHDQAARPAADRRADHLRHQHPGRTRRPRWSSGSRCAPSSPGRGPTATPYSASSRSSTRTPRW